MTDWRSADDYAALMDADAATLAWEFLRRNEAFRAQHKTLVAKARRNSLTGAERQAYAHRWGLRFRPRP